MGRLRLNDKGREPRASLDAINHRVFLRSPQTSIKPIVNICPSYHPILI